MKNIIAFSSYLSMSWMAFASQEGFQVIAGEATAPVNQNGQIVVQQSSDRAVIHWDQFSIDAQETFRFEQPNENSAILNRVIGGDASQILGCLSSNGQVFLINPNGILIGPGGRVETASFIASSLEVLTAEFLASNQMIFSGSGLGSIVNLGTIHCESGHVALIGRIVKNQGTIKAPNGQVELGVGSDILFSPASAPHIYIRAGVETDQPVQEGAALSNEGAISALVVELRSQSNVFTKAIQGAGQTDALSIEERGGEIYLVADGGAVEVSGKMNATNQEGKGGQVHILGKDIAMLNGSYVDVSGKTGGGTILIGGDYQGQNPAIINAQHVLVEENVMLASDAVETGNGGKIIVWSDEATRFYGKGCIRGGALNGNGGLAEVAGKYLDYTGLIDAAAVNGSFGELVIESTGPNP